jgi:hypothetical protein
VDQPAGAAEVGLAVSNPRRVKCNFLRNINLSASAFTFTAKKKPAPD